MLSWKMTSFGLVLFFAVLTSPVVTVAVSTPADDQRPRTLEQSEQRLLRTMIRASQYVDVPHSGTRAACEQVEPPQALTTPDPLLGDARHGEKVKVSFIIGTDGRVHSPLILQSAGLAGDRRVLQTVRTWRYRPATCNGVPTETEGKVEFSLSGQ
jgi:TonB family protein